MSDKRDPTDILIAEINGACKPHIQAGINGNIPGDWSCGQLSAMRNVGAAPGAGSVVVFADACRATYDVGVRVCIDAPFDHLALAALVATELTAKIRAREELGSPVLFVHGEIKFTLGPGAIAPTRGTEGSSGYDLYSPTDVLIRAGQILVIHSGVCIQLPDDTWEGEIRGRSGMSKRGLWVAVGTVDSDYRGVIGATVRNMTSDDAKVSKGDRYAQLVIGRVAHPEWTLVETLDDSARGTGGFGSTGR